MEKISIETLKRSIENRRPKMSPFQAFVADFLLHEASFPISNKEVIVHPGNIRLAHKLFSKERRMACVN
jgi:hypothetical protein